MGKSLFAIAAVAVALYANTLSNELVFDDLKLIPENPQMHDPWDVGGIIQGRYWGEVLHSRHYRPLTVWSLALNYWLNEKMGLDGGHVVGFHLLNLALHTVVSCVLYVMLLRLSLPPPASLAAALLFAAHPIHTEAVTFITGRAEPLAALLILAFLLLHTKGKWVAAAACYLFALLSKESAAIALFVVGWLDLCLGWFERSRWKFYGAYGAVLLGWILLRIAVLKDLDLGISNLDNPLVDASWVERLYTAAAVQVDYLRLQLWPVGLSSDYSYKQVPLVDRFFDAGVLLFIAVTAAAVAGAWHARRAYPLVPLALGGYALAAAPTSNMLVLIPTIMGERLAYFPSLFFCLLAGWGLWMLRRKLGAGVWAGGGVLLIAWSALTVARNATWANAEVFYRAQYQSAPNSARAHMGMGKMHAQSGRLDSAMQYYRSALTLFPQYALGWYNLGLTQAMRREWDAALISFRRAVQQEPGYVKAWYNLGGVHMQRGETEKALTAFERMVKLDPQNADAWNSIGSVHAHRKSWPAALEAFQKAVAFNPRHADARHNLDLVRRQISTK